MGEFRKCQTRGDQLVFIDRIASRAVAMCVRASYRDDASFMTEKYLLFCDEYLWLVFLFLLFTWSDVNASIKLIKTGGFEGFIVNRQAHRPRPDRRQIQGNNPNIPRYSSRSGERAMPAPPWQWKINPPTVRQPHLEIPVAPSEPDFRGLGNTELPIYQHRHQIIDSVESNRITILSGETGSGKTTQTWQYLLGEGYDVIVMLPRRVIVDGLYDRAVDELKEQRGEEVAREVLGMVHSERRITADTNRVTFMTPGTYLRMIPSIRETYSGKNLVVMADELHEANFYMEIATGEVASMLEQEPTWRLVASSATHDKIAVERALTPVNGREIPSVEIKGRPHDLEWHEDPNRDVAEIYLEYGDDHKSTIIFTSGKEEIKEVISDIKKRLHAAGRDDVIFRKLHAGITRQERERLTAPIPEGKRLVIVSTNAGQSGITLPGATLVITDGEIKREELDIDASSGLALRFASRAELVQQAGRGGRDVDGGVFYLGRPTRMGAKFVSSSSPERSDHAPAEIYSQNLGRSALMMAALERDLSDLNPYLIHRVDEDPIRSAYRRIFELGAVDSSRKITSLGKQMDKLAPRPELSRAVVEAWQGGYSLRTMAQVAMIAASIESGGLAYFARDAGKRWTELLRDTTSDDMIAQLDMFVGINPFFDGRYFDENGLLGLDIDPKNARTAYKQYAKMMRAMGMGSHVIDLLPPNHDEEEDIRECMLSGMIGTIYRRTGSAGRANIPVYRAIRNDDGNGLIRDRLLSDRSVYDPVVDQKRDLVAALPRWYQTRKSLEGDPETVYIIEQVMPVTAGKLTKYVLGLLQVDDRGTVIRGGRVVSVGQPKFGDLEIGGEVERRPSQLTKEAGSTLLKYVRDNPGRNLRELRSMVRQIADLMRLIPTDEHGSYFKDTNITQARIDALLREAVRECDNADDVDIRLGMKMNEQNLNLGHWITDDNAEAILSRSPDNLYVEGLSRNLKLHYRHGKPVATGLKVSDIKFLPDLVRLDDGRDVYFQMTSGGKKVLVSAPEAKSRIFV